MATTANNLIQLISSLSIPLGLAEELRTPTFLLELINEAQQKFARDTDIVKQTDTDEQPNSQTTVEDQNEYDLPDDFLAAERVALDGNTIHPVSYNEIQAMIDGEDSISESVYSVWADQLWIYPDDDSGVELEVWYIKKPSNLTAYDSTIDIPDDLKMALIYRVLFNLLLASNRKNDAVVYQALYETYVQDGIERGRELAGSTRVRLKPVRF